MWWRHDDTHHIYERRNLVHNDVTKCPYLIAFQFHKLESRTVSGLAAPDRLGSKPSD